MRKRATVIAGNGSERPAEPSVHQLRLFVVLSEELHFRRAAALLFITQSALSQQIRDLEQRLGVRLFDRTSRAVALTVAGRALLPEARAAVDAVARVRRTADAQARQLSGRLVVGTIGAEAAMPHTRAVLGALRDRHPRMTPQVVSLNFADHFAALLRQEVDVMFLRPPVPAGIEVRRLATEPRVACLPASDPLASLPSVSLAQLAGRPVVAMPEKVPRVWWDFWAVDPRPDGSPVRYGPVATDMESLLHAVAGGEAMCFLPAAARDLFPRPGIRYLDVTDLEPCSAALAWLAERRDEPTIAAVREAAHTVLRGG
ncbi:LysR family transcriptional regulator [Streptomyces turgidiscabies]|uniref:Putative isoleucine biosynthesis transcriptional activator IlvR n=1 Tax=Streptomyces turgidiscabies (strain Car8) TaxID=698760 RepID=L7EZ45_STRT8|nr:putative isoleucine biosynthesis transcriptional activator IlvR [Streptomyces turgidiscabies Car8]GAQ73217.1 hca operon transcriptional activator [Streptomyces turgidiscabies]